MADETRATIETRSGEELIVRRLRADDGSALQAFNAGLSERSRYFFLPHSYTDSSVARRVERAEQGLDLCYVVLAGGRIVGYFFLWNCRERVPLLGIGVTDDYQGQGLGRQMMEILIADAREADRDGIELTTRLDNDRAFSLYQKCGFRYIGDVENVDGNGDVVVERGMFLPLKRGARPMDGPHKPPD